MRVKILIVTAVTALVAAGAAFAGNGPQRSVLYSFLGKLGGVTPTGQIAITVEGGNRPALRAMLGQPVAQTFAVDGTTEFLKWSAGVPTVIHAGDLVAGDYVWVRVRDNAGASLGDIESKAAAIVGDHGTQLYRPDKPLYLFRGKLTAVGAQSVTVDVASGDLRAMHLLLGQPTSQTFAAGDSTIFLLWQGKVPTVISLGQLNVGDVVVVRIRADQGSSLAQVESTPAAHVGDREPAAQS